MNYNAVPLIDHGLDEKNKKGNWINERWIWWKILTKFVGLRAKTYSYLIHDGREDKKANGTKKCIIKNIKFENYKNCLEATQLKNKINHLEKKKISTDSLTKSLKTYKKQ